MKCFKNLHFLSLLVLLQVGWSQVPQGFSYQGVLTELSGDVVVDGNYVLTFRLYDAATGGNELGMEQQALVPVTNGVFSVTLGAELNCRCRSTSPIGLVCTWARAQNSRQGCS